MTRNVGFEFAWSRAEDLQLVGAQTGRSVIRPFSPPSAMPLTHTPSFPPAQQAQISASRIHKHARAHSVPIGLDGQFARTRGT